MKLAVVVVILAEVISVFECEVIEFETYVEPTGPWGRQPILLGEDGGYGNILIAVHPDVDEDLTLLDKIKEVFNSTSHHLYEVTSRTLYLKEITILIPDHWTQRPEYSLPRLNETTHTARVLIRNMSGAGRPPSASFVRHPTVCGEEGEFIYLPSGRLPGNNGSGMSDLGAEQLVYLWSQFRWGIGQPPSSDETQVPSYCVSYGDHWAELSSNGEDFQNRVRSNHKDVTPAFRLVKSVDLLFMVILDARQNMKDDGKFERMIDKYKYYAWHLFPTYSWMGAVTMNNNTVIRTHNCLKLWELAGYRGQSFRFLPTEANGTSSLGNAVIESIAVLRDVRTDIRNSTIFIMSDGTDTVSPTLAEVYDEITEAGVIIASLPFSANQSENIVLNNTIEVNITEGVLNKLTRLEDRSRFVRIVATDIFQLKSDDYYPFPLYDTDREYEYVLAVVRLRTDQDIDQLNITALSLVEGRSLYPNAISDDGNIIDFISYQEAEDVEVASSFEQNVSVEIFLGDFSTKNRTIFSYEMMQARTIVSQISHGFSSVTSGVPVFTVITRNQRPVLDAVVKARVTRPDGTEVELELNDDGENNDITASDGTYSAVFNDITIEGDYRIRTTVEATQSCLKFSDECVLVPESYRAPDDRAFNVSGIPPSTISDFSADEVIERTVTLTWTAPGGDLMYGRADHYRLKYTTDLSLPLRIPEYTPDMLVVFGNSSTTQPAGNREYLNVSFVDIIGSSFFLAVQAIDEHGNSGIVSNVIQVTFTESLLTTMTPVAHSTTDITTQPEQREDTEASEGTTAYRITTPSDVTTGGVTTPAPTSEHPTTVDLTTSSQSSLTTDTMLGVESTKVQPTTLSQDPTVPTTTTDVFGVIHPTTTRVEGSYTTEASSPASRLPAIPPSPTGPTVKSLKPTTVVHTEPPPPTKKAPDYTILPKPDKPKITSKGNDGSGNIEHGDDNTYTAFKEKFVTFVKTDKMFPVYIVTLILITTAATVWAVVIIRRRRNKRKREEEMQTSAEQFEMEK